MGTTYNMGCPIIPCNISLFTSRHSPALQNIAISAAGVVFMNENCNVVEICTLVCCCCVFMSDGMETTMHVGV
jgi:hypothetical protein